MDNFRDNSNNSFPSSPNPNGRNSKNPSLTAPLSPFFPSTPSSDGRSSRSQSRNSLISPFSPNMDFLESNTYPSFLPTPMHPDESQQDQDGFWNDGPPPYAVSEPPQPVTIAIRKKNEPACPSTSVDTKELVQEYQAIMLTKGKVDGRRFNKMALALLDKCVSALKNPVSNNAVLCSMKEPTISSYRQDAKEAFGEFRMLLLNDKEMHSETLVERVVSFIEKLLPPLLTADEKREELQKKTLALIAELSPSMSIKIAPIVKSYISRQFGSDLDDLLAEVRLPEMSAKEKTLMYSRMFGNFMDDPGCVFFAATNKQLLGNLEPVDIWFLTFFAFVTTRRSRGDNLLMLGLVGRLHIPFTIFIVNHFKNCFN